MKRHKNRFSLLVVVMVIFIGTPYSYAAPTAYTSQSINGAKINYITVNPMDQTIAPIVLQANHQLRATQSLSSMASEVGAICAVNGTYFEAYGGVPVPWGMIIKDGKILHAGGGAAFGITKDNRFLVDNLGFQFESYADGKMANTIWRVNHPSTETDAITVFTPEYGSVAMPQGGKAVLVENGVISAFAVSNFQVPKNGFAILFNQSAVEFMYDRYELGMECYYSAKILPKYTKAEDWENVVCGLGAGPSLIINGQITAKGEAEGFFEDKINKNKAGRTFIGANAEGKILMGNMGSVTLQEAAKNCKSLGLVNAICLDGGGSIALYYKPSGIATGGRAINNGIGFISVEPKTVENQTSATTSTLLIDGKKIVCEAYSIQNNNYFKLRDLAMALGTTEKKFQVSWNPNKNAVELTANADYTPVGGELENSPNQGQKQGYKKMNSQVYLDGAQIKAEAYAIGTNNYFKLRDIGICFDFGVAWDEPTKTISIDTTKGYGN